jgi:hypothetical protein
VPFFVLVNGVLEPNGQLSRALQRSQSLQPPVALAVASSSSSSQSQYHQLKQQKFYLNNYTNHQNTSSHKPNNEGPRAKVSRLNSSPASATITSEQQLQQKQLPAPLTFPIQISYNIDSSSGSSAIESPAVKIDYSKFTLPATSPSIKIDLTNFNQQVNKPAANASGLDEDYDV